jgi:type II secretory pathway pseudopilin PulG
MVGRLDIAVVVGCLGIVAVVAVPRHARISTEARVAEVKALARGASTSAELAHARWLAAAQPQTIAGVRGVVAMTHGYPSAATVSLMLSEAETGAFRYEDGAWHHASVPAGTPCGVTYQPPAAAGQPPVITDQTAGC